MTILEQYDENIRKYGCQIICVNEEGDLPPFAYSIGIYKTTKCPEVVVFGLKHNLAMSMINHYCRGFDNDDIDFKDGRYDGFIAGFKIKFGKIKLEYYDEYFGQLQRYYGSNKFKIVQLIYPNTVGVWPDDKNVSAWFKNRQPILR